MVRHHDLPETLTGGGRRLRLPDGHDIACQTVNEAKFFYEDIFTKRIYHRHGIRLQGARCVLDVGANIGLFTLFVRRECPQARVYAFEPAPPLFEILRHNTRAHRDCVKLFPCGIGAQPGRAEFTFYPQSSGMSSLYADIDEERTALEGIFRNQQLHGDPGVDALMQHSDDLLAERLRSERFPVELRSISQVLRDESIDRVDLLKIDVQKAEADVIAGIDASDWPKIQQLVIEVHDISGRLAQVTAELEGRGFEVVAEQDDHYESSTTWNLFAIRPQSTQHAGRSPLRPARQRAAALQAAVEAQQASASAEGVA
ncbi:MAG: FkbM family methyltransferase [Acidobacteriota bacterium]